MESGRDDNKPKITNTHFEENRRKIQDLFLKNAVQEFHTVQGNFHRNMGKIVRGFDAVKTKFPDDTRHIINELLQPYRLLTKNPFRMPTGNVQNDLSSIMTTIKDQNEEFKKTLEASLNAISNLEKFNAVLQECQGKEEVVAELNNNFESERRGLSEVELAVAQPLRQVMQYPLLVNNIEKNIPAEMAVEHENLAQDVQVTMSVLAPQIQAINENKDDLTILNKIDDVLKHLLDIEIAKEESASDKSEPSNNNNVSTEDENASSKFDNSLRLSIEAVKLSLERGRYKLLHDNAQDPMSLHHGLLDLLRNLQEQYANVLEPESGPMLADKSIISSATSYATSAGYYLLKLPVMFFYNTEKASENTTKANALEKPELNKVIIELSRFIEMRELAEKFLTEHLPKFNR